MTAERRARWHRRPRMRPETRRVCCRESVSAILDDPRPLVYSSGCSLRNPFTDVAGDSIVKCGNPWFPVFRLTRMLVKKITKVGRTLAYNNHHNRLEGPGRLPGLRTSSLLPGWNNRTCNRTYRSRHCDLFHMPRAGVLSSVRPGNQSGVRCLGGIRRRRSPASPQAVAGRTQAPLDLTRLFTG